MLFNTYEFLLLFLPITVLLYALLPRLRQPILLLANLIFYASAGWGTLLLLLLMTGSSFIGAAYGLTSTNPLRKRLGLLAVCSPLLWLLFFKYANLLATPLSGGVLSLALPLGISFYTFNLLSYGLDVYRGLIPAERRILPFVTTITFFPTILSGPLTRYAQLEPQLAARTPERDRGIFLLALGLAKKILIADAVAALINPLWAEPETLGLVGAWFTVVGFAYQLYFDFSGYTDMATGIAFLLGIHLPQNFNAPYSARNITEFWQRWHMTLSTWFREYLFLPLSRSLLRRWRTRPDAVRTVALVVTMALTGIWHGGSGTFLIWGVYHGVLLAAHAQARAWRWQAWPQVIGRAVTFGAVLIGWVIFRSPSLEVAGQMGVALVGVQGWGLDVLRVNDGPLRYTDFLLLGVLLVLTNLPRDSWQIHPRQQWAYGAGVAVLLVLSILALGQPNPFLYLQF
jgi:alginate O-acetyltransferase complex protein AlgI